MLVLSTRSRAPKCDPNHKYGGYANIVILIRLIILPLPKKVIVCLARKAVATESQTWRQRDGVACEAASRISSGYDESLWQIKFILFTKGRFDNYRVGTGSVPE